MTSRWVRDQWTDAAGAILFGCGPLAVAVTLLILPESDGGTRTGAFWFAMVSVPFMAVAAIAATHRVAFSESGVEAISCFGKRSIDFTQLSAIRASGVQRVISGHAVPLVLVLKDERRKTSIRVTLRSRVLAKASLAWLPAAMDAVIAGWRNELSAGKAIAFSGGVRLTASSLECRRVQIDLTKEFVLDEVPATDVSAQTMRVEGGGERILIEGNQDNYEVLVRYLRSLSTANSRRQSKSASA